MSKRKTPEDYRKLGESKGFEWVGPEVKNTKIKTWWHCSGGHKFESRYNDVDQGHGCPRCAGVIRKTKRDYQTLAMGREFKFLGNKAPGNTKMDVLWECEDGHQWLASFNRISRGNGCPHCYGNLRKTPRDYISLAALRGFKWLGPEVSNTTIKTTWECHNHHKWDSSYGNIKSGYGCPHCSKQVSRSAVEYHELALIKGLHWEGSLPSSVHSKTKWRCPKGHCWGSTHTRIRLGTGCPTCNNRVPKTSSDYYVLATSRKFKWIGLGVSNTKVKTTWECEKNHRWEMSYNQVQRGRGCPLCHREQMPEQAKKRWADGVYDGVFQGPTSIEKETAKALNNLEIEHISQYRPNGYSRIYDEFIIPNILVEVQGSYWHGPERPEQQKKDAEKAQWAKNNGFIPVIFWEHEIREQGAEALIKERILPLLR